MFIVCLGHWWATGKAASRCGSRGGVGGQGGPPLLTALLPAREVLSPSGTILGQTWPVPVLDDFTLQLEGLTQHGAHFGADPTACWPRAETARSARTWPPPRASTLQRLHRGLALQPQVGPSVHDRAGRSGPGDHLSWHPLGQRLEALWRLPQVAGCRWVVSGQCEDQQQDPRALGRQHSGRPASAHGCQICVPALSRQQDTEATHRPLETTFLSKQMSGEHSAETHTHKTTNLQRLSLNNDIHPVMHQAVFHLQNDNNSRWLRGR